MTKCPHCDKEQKIEDTRLRSLLKTVTSNLEEVLVDTVIIGSILTLLGLPYAFAYGTGLSLVVETICGFIHYFNDRLWNRISWGRKALLSKNQKEEDTNRVEHL